MQRLAIFTAIATGFLGQLSSPGAELAGWALAAPSATAPPVVRDTAWPRKPLDHFILAKIEAAGQLPVGSASRSILARRAYIDLLGLPPTTDQIDAFVQDTRADAWPRLIDALLASPRYGERWGRHWLDVARYADSNGMDEDIAHPQAYRYRDYVIAAFNADMPFDRFITEQLAGDLLPAANLAERRSQTTGLGFLAVGPKMLACDDPDKMRRDIVDEQIDTTGRAFLGITLGCARCHDHKFDPVSIDDYYGLAGIFMSTKTLTKYSVVAEFFQYDLSEPEHRQRHQQIAELEKLRGEDGTPEDEKQKLAEQIASLNQDLPPPFEIMGVTENPTEDVRVHLRGDYLTLGELVPRSIPARLGGKPEPMPADQSGRLELAKWIASPDNPLTARVIANRIWRWHFGRGIVATPDNFGALGTPPTHPGLLDHLATLLVQSGWSIKSLHREIMGSATYQQSALASAELKEADPENLLFARWRPRRLESEALRDSILAKSGRLDLTMGGSMLAVRPNHYVDRAKLPEYAQSTRRTTYLPVLRSSGLDGQNAFDFADPTRICGDRRSSTIATQALFLMNSPLLHESSNAFARHLLEITPGQTSSERAASAILHILGREATASEIGRAEPFIASYPAADAAAGWAAFTRVLLSSNEFLYIE